MNNKTKGITYIGAEMTLNGEMDIKGPALIAGKVTGIVRSNDQIKIEPGGEVDGEVFCQELRVSGTLKGKLFCNKLVIVSAGLVEADVSSHDMEIYDGGQFIGMRTTGPEANVLPMPAHAIPNETIEPVNNRSHPNHDLTDIQQSVPSTPAKNLDSSADDNKVQPNSKSSKAFLTVSALVVIAVGVWQFDALSLLKSPKPTSNEPALFTQPLPSVDNVTERNAAKLLKDVQNEHSFIEQREELVNAGLADPDVAMEDLDAMAASNELMADGNEAAATVVNDAGAALPANENLQKQAGNIKEVASKPTTKQ